MISALALSLVMIPMWAFGISPLMLVVGAFLMQVGVQGAWGSSLRTSTNYLQTRFGA